MNPQFVRQCSVWWTGSSNKKDQRIMKNHSIHWAKPFALSVAICVVAACPHRAQAIVSGQLDGDGHPNVGGFVWPKGFDLDFDGEPDWDLDEDGLPDVSAVTGNQSLIHPRVVVLVGHVTELFFEDFAAGYYTINEAFVAFSPDLASDHGKLWGISAIITHPDYNPKVNTAYGASPVADIGVIVLKEPVEGITPATLPPLGYLDSLAAAGYLKPGNPRETTVITSVGYGDHGVAPNQHLPPDGKRRVAESRYKLHVDRWLFVDANTAHANSGTMNYDSGGPAFVRDPITGEEILVGLTSRGDAVGVALGLKYRVDIPEALDFIHDVIDRVEAGEFD